MSSIHTNHPSLSPMPSACSNPEIREIIHIPVPIDHTGRSTVENLKRQFLFSCEECFSPETATATLYKTIKSALPKFGIPEFKVPEDDFHECIKNSYDAFVDSSNFQSGKHLILELVIKEKNDTCKVKLKDNGTGFIKKQKGERFTPTDESFPFSEYAKKKRDKTHLGGIKDGVYFMLKNTNAHRIEVDFKNRKKDGAAVTWTLTRDL